ncbi:MAG: radical SAM protein [Nanoarchaeota archaeon]
MRKIAYLKLVKYLFNKNTKGPVQLIHFITSKCNAKCKHCFYWKNLNQNTDLKLKEINKITKTLPDLYFLLISGGEPFLRKDFVDIVTSYYKNTNLVELTVPTNGLLTHKIINDSKQILENCPGLELNIVISLDGKEEIHDQIRGVPGCFNKAVKSLFELKELKKKYKCLKVSIVSTLMSVNQKEMSALYKYVKYDLKPDVFSVNLIRSTPKKPNLKNVNLDYFKEILKLEEYELKKGKGFKGKVRNMMHKLRTKIIIDTIEKKKYVIPCYAAKLTGVLSEDGTVYPCEMLGKEIGNIKDFDYDLRKVWGSKEAKNYRKFIKKTKCFCTHECFLRINILFNPMFLIKSYIKNKMT